MSTFVPELSAMMVRNLGACRIESPLKSIFGSGMRYHADTDRVLYEAETARLKNCGTLENIPSFEQAGPRELIYFDPSKTRVGIVTCGGLCPGLNDVIRSLVLTCWHMYGVRRIYGFKYGYQGFIAQYKHEVIDFNPEEVDGIQDFGGTMLGSSRGAQEPAEVVDCLERLGVNILFVIGGDGTLRGALKMAEEIEARKAKIAIVGIPKTIDNDIALLDESFGFQSAYSKAVEVLHCAHAEAKGVPNGIGLVKLMGRHSGFIACHAALAMSDVNFVLIPEVPFQFEGENGLLASLRRRLEKRGHAVIAVAEGAGQELMAHAEAILNVDASGNKKLKDVGVFLRERIEQHFAGPDGDGREITVKYFDPSYLIRSVKASPQDSIYCMRLAQNAVHAAMCGKTEMLVGRWHGHFVNIPIALSTRERKRVEPKSSLWRSVLEATGQPVSMT